MSRGKAGCGRGGRMGEGGYNKGRSRAEGERGGVTARPPVPSEVRRHGVVQDAAGAADPHPLRAAVAARARLGVLIPTAHLLLVVRADEAARALLSPLRAPRVLDLPVLDGPADGL